MGITDHLTWLLRNLYAGQEATVRTGHGTDWFKIGKGVCQGCILPLCLFSLYAEYILQNAGLDEAQARIKISGRNINNLRYTDDTTLMTESKEELKSLLMMVKEKSKKAGFKFKIQKTKVMASEPISSWQIDGETVETVTDFNFWAPKSLQVVTTAIKLKDTWLLTTTKLDSALESRHITLLAKTHVVITMVFAVVMYRNEIWTIKKDEHWSTGVFELWCWRRLLGVPWTARRSIQSILKEIHPEYSLEGLMLKLQYFSHMMWRGDLLEKILMLGKTEGKMRRWWQRMKWLNGITNSMDLNFSKLWGIVHGVL